MRVGDGEQPAVVTREEEDGTLRCGWVAHSGRSAVARAGRGRARVCGVAVRAWCAERGPPALAGKTVWVLQHACSA